MREIIEQIVREALTTAIEGGELPATDAPDPAVERPRDAAHGDWASSVAMKSARLYHRAPREIAEIIASHIADADQIDKVEVAGPGFINMTLSNAALQSVISQVRGSGRTYGNCNDGAGRRVQVEFVSSNPTGPMHVGHGRWAALGDSMANVLAACGWDVEREFYINDAGNQMDHFAHSVVVRYLQIVALMEQGGGFEDAVEALVSDTVLPEEERRFAAELGPDSYGGAYVVDIAAEILSAEGAGWAQRDAAEREAYFKERAYSQVFDHVREVLERAGVHFDVWFSERTLHAPDENGASAIDREIAHLRELGHIEDRDGAVWFTSTEFGDDKDRVLVKADGDTTYFAADIAYHADKFSRGFDRVIDIWGADHHGYVARMKAAMEAIGHGGKLDIVIGQLVNLLRDGQPVRLSKRAGTMVTFEELLDEVGRDATRYLMIAKSTDQPIDFDIELAKKQDSSNPVFYVQYAHARICSIMRRAAGFDSSDEAADIEEISASVIGDSVDYSLLVEPEALELARKLSEFPDILKSSAADLAPFRLTHYATDLAGAFHRFYTQVHVLGSDPGYTRARLAAIDACRIVLGRVLELLGVSAPVKM